MLVGIQLYALRNLIQAEGIETAFARTRDCGYDCVEPYYADFGIGLSAVGDCMRRYGLQSLSAHVPYEILSDAEKLEEYRCAYGFTTAVLPSLPKDVFYDEEKLREVMETVLKTAQTHGLKIAYHNHDFEFERPDALTRLPRLYPPLKLQPDVFWLKAAGLDPLRFLEENADSIALIHLKEFASAVADPSPVAGDGTVGAREIIRFARKHRHESIVLEYEAPCEEELAYIGKSLAFIREVIHE